MGFLNVRCRRKGLTTPVKYFRSKTKREVVSALTEKYGLPTHTPPYKKVWFDKETGRSFVIHKEPDHHEGRPHVDITIRGSRRKRTIYLKGES